MFNRISHIGVVVSDIEQALVIWRDRLGFRQFAEAYFEAEGIRSVFLSLSGQSRRDEHRAHGAGRQDPT